jgi:hypothetical protein
MKRIFLSLCFIFLTSIVFAAMPDVASIAEEYNKTEVISETNPQFKRITSNGEVQKIVESLKDGDSANFIVSTGFMGIIKYLVVLYREGNEIRFWIFK